MEITRSGILRDCLEETNREMHKYSRHGNGLLPMEGYENHFADLSAKCAMLRAMILEAESREEQVKSDEPRGSRPLAQWQKDLIGCTVTNGWPNPEKDGWLIEHNGKNYMWNPDNQEWELLHADDKELAAGKMTPDEVALRRRYRKAQDFKPAPVVYPGGEDDGTVQD